MTDDLEMTVLEVRSDKPYDFELGAKFTWDDEAFDLEPVDSAAELINRVVAFGTEALKLQPWDDALAADAVAECDGYSTFDQFMALPLVTFPVPE